MFRRSVGIVEAKLGAEDDEQMCDTLRLLDSLAHAAGRLEEAKELLQRCLGVLEAKLGPTDVQIAYTLLPLGCCLRKAGRFDEAEGFLRRCLCVLERFRRLGYGSPTVVVAWPRRLTFTDLFVDAIVEKVVIPRQVLGRWVPCRMATSAHLGLQVVKV